MFPTAPGPAGPVPLVQEDSLCRVQGDPPYRSLPIMPTAEKAASTSRQQLIDALNEDLAREYQAIIAYVVYSQTLKGAAYMAIAKELEAHAGEELSHAITIAKHIDYLGGEP